MTTKAADAKAKLEVLKLKVQSGAMSELERRDLVATSSMVLLLGNTGTSEQRVALARATHAYAKMTGSIQILDLLGDAIAKHVPLAEALLGIIDIYADRDAKQMARLHKALKAIVPDMPSPPNTGTPTE